MITYKHRVAYYETDKMGITHHSNYIRWMEEARVRLMDEIGCTYRSTEDMGIVIPVLSVDCNYRKSTTFDELITIETKISKMRPVKVFMSYVMKNEEGVIVATGESSHGFINESGRPIMLSKTHPDVYEAFLKYVEE